MTDRCALGLMLLAIVAPMAAAQTLRDDLRLSRRLEGLARFGEDDLLKIPRVQNELNLSESQKSRVMKIEQEGEREIGRYTTETEDVLKQLKEKGDGDAYRELNVQYRSARRALTEKKVAMMEKVLDKRQQARLNQLLLRALGPRAFERPDVQDRLNLGPDQVEAIAVLFNQTNNSINQGENALQGQIQAAVIPGPGGRRVVEIEPAKRKSIDSTRAQLKKQAAGLRQSMDREILRLLTKKQREKYQAMLGEPFEFVKPRQPGSKAAGEK
jgi:hypothetical protein